MFERKRRTWTAILIACLGLLAMIIVSCLVAVDESEYAIITTFGRVGSVYGGEKSDPGLKIKLPWQGVTRVDRRLRSIELPMREVITGDRRNLEVAAYAVYEVADPVAYVRGAGTRAMAEARLGERVAAEISDAIGRRDLATIATTEPARWGLDRLTVDVAAALAPSALSELGLRLLDVGLRRFNYPLEVRPAVFELIRSERKQVAARLRAEGEAEYTRLTSEADRQRDGILARSEAEAERIRGEGQAEATRILNDAHRLDPRFFEFLRTLDSFASILDARTTIVLSTSSPLLKLLSQGPVDGRLPDLTQDRGSSTAGAADNTRREGGAR